MNEFLRILIDRLETLVNVFSDALPNLDAIARHLNVSIPTINEYINNPQYRFPHWISGNRVKSSKRAVDEWNYYMSKQKMNIPIEGQDADES